VGAHLQDGLFKLLLQQQVLHFEVASLGVEDAQHTVQAARDDFRCHHAAFGVSMVAKPY
jgi:hypothetical protein